MLLAGLRPALRGEKSARTPRAPAGGLAQYRLDKKNDALDALDGQRLAVAGRLVEQHNDLSEGTLQFGDLAVLRTGAGQFRTRSLAHAWVAAQATSRPQRRATVDHRARPPGTP